MMKPKPVPLYPSLEELRNYKDDDYPELVEFIDSLNNELDAKIFWQYGKDFLLLIGRSKSIHTFNRFRNEVERFLNWVFLIHRHEITDPDDPEKKILIPISPLNLERNDFLDYINFCNKPTENWIGEVSVARFTFKNGYYTTNKSWKPFKMQITKAERKRYKDRNEDPPKPKKNNYRASQQSIQAIFTGIIAFYQYLNDEEVCEKNYARWAKKNCQLIIKDTSSEKVKRLNKDQWDYAIKTAEKMPSIDSKYERNLFLLVTMKTLFLRISELSERPNWAPVMGHFYIDHNDHWWLEVLGKGNKKRDVSVPTAYLDYLKRYRIHRKLFPLPSPGDKEPIIEKLRGGGSPSTRSLHDMLQETFDFIYEELKKTGSARDVKRFSEASSHWLRHTGASMEIERGRRLKDLSMDLGHSSMATTDTVYVKTEDRIRAESGKDREI